jgi:hypothetical protein
MKITDNDIKLFFGNGRHDVVVYIKDGVVKRYVFGEKKTEVVATREQAEALLQRIKGVS